MLLALWALLTAFIVGAILTVDLRRAEQRLALLASHYTQHVSDRTPISETAIEGSAAFAASQDSFDERRTREFARSLPNRYGFLCMFEVARMRARKSRRGRRLAAGRDAAAQ